MKYFVTWLEDATILNKCSGWVEAKSEQEAIALVKAGEVDLLDCSTYDILDSSVTSIENIYEDEE